MPQYVLYYTRVQEEEEWGVADRQETMRWVKYEETVEEQGNRSVYYIHLIASAKALYRHYSCQTSDSICPEANTCFQSDNRT